MATIFTIPHYGNSGNAVGWGGDIIAAGHQWMNHVLACTGNAGMAVFVGTVLGSKTFSPKLAVYADEVIAQARRISKGFEVDDYSILMREIVAAGPAGNFLSSDLTLKHFRQAYFQSTIFPSFTMEDWSSDGCPKAENHLSRYTNDMIEDLSISDESFAMIEIRRGIYNQKFKKQIECIGPLWKIQSKYQSLKRLFKFEKSLVFQAKRPPDPPVYSYPDNTISPLLPVTSLHRPYITHPESFRKWI